MTSIKDFKNTHGDQQKKVNKKIVQDSSEQGHVESSEETPFI